LQFHSNRDVKYPKFQRNSTSKFRSNNINFPWLTLMKIQMLTMRNTDFFSASARSNRGTGALASGGLGRVALLGYSELALLWHTMQTNQTNANGRCLYSILIPACRAWKWKGEKKNFFWPGTFVTVVGLTE
jgi:hypothetical protein